MTTKTRYAVKFGNDAPIPVEKAAYHGATLTKAVDEIRQRIDDAVAELENVTSVRQARNRDFKSKIVRKKARNIFMKIGYGKNNEEFSEVLIGFFDCPVRAKHALLAARDMISAGDFDQDIADLLELKKERAKKARLARRKLITAPVEVITHFRVIAAE
jgi:hypothetical protein